MFFLRLGIELLAPAGVEVADFFAQLAQLLHAAQRMQQRRTGQLGPLAVDFEKFEAVGTNADPRGALPIAGLQITLEQIRRLEDVAVGIDQQLFVSHILASVKGFES